MKEHIFCTRNFECVDRDIFYTTVTDFSQESDSLELPYYCKVNILFHFIVIKSIPIKCVVVDENCPCIGVVADIQTQKVKTG